MSEYIKISDIPFRDLAEGHNTDIKVLVAFASDIANLPTIDIVHCKDCKYSKVYALDSNEEPQRWCKVGLAKAVDDDDYCRWGE